MIRPFTCICMLMAAGSGLYLYQTKHRAQMLDREIARTFKQIDLAKDRIGILKGEWALLNEPDRLNELAQQHLSLKTLAPTQFVALADLPSRLPAPLPPGTATIASIVMPPADPVPAPVVAAPAAPAVATAKPVTPVPATPKLLASNDKAPEKPASPPATTTAARATPHATTPATAATAAPAASQSVLAAAARTLPPPVPVAPAAPVPLAARAAPHITAPIVTVSAGSLPGGASHAQAPGSIGESVARATARNRAPMMIPATTTAQPAYAAQPSYPTQPVAGTAYNQGTYAPPSYGQGSLLGGAARIALPAPVPFGAAQAGR